MKVNPKNIAARERRATQQVPFGAPWRGPSMLFGYDEVVLHLVHPGRGPRSPCGLLPLRP